MADKPRVTRLFAALERADRENDDGCWPLVDGKALINEATKPLLEIIANNTVAGRAGGREWRLDRSRRQARRQECRQPDRLAAAAGFVDKGFGASDIIAKDYVKPD